MFIIIVRGTPPAILGTLIFILIPVICSFGLSFAKWDLLNPIQFVGLQNYIDIFHSSVFYKIFTNTVVFALSVSVLGVIIPLVLASILNSRIRGSEFFKTAYFLPFITPMIVIGIVWAWIFDPNIGLLSQVLHIHINWLYDSKFAMPALIIVSVLNTLCEKFDFPNRIENENRVNNLDAPVSETKYIETKSNVQTGYMMFGWLGPRAAELKDSICLDLISIIFGDGSSSRLQQNLIEKLPEQIFNMIGSEHYQFKDGNNFFIQANFKPEYKEKALELVKQELANLLTNRITEEELAKAKKRTKSRFAYAAETVSEIGETIGSTPKSPAGV